MRWQHIAALALTGCSGVEARLDADDTGADANRVVLVRWCTTPALAPLPDARAVAGGTHTALPVVTAGQIVRWRKSFGPDEVQVDATTGRLTWDIPAGQAGESFHVGVIGVDRCGNTVEDVWIVTVGDGAVLTVGVTHATVWDALAAASGGDTIVLPSREYLTDRDNFNSNPSPAAMPPSGSPTGWTTVIAEEPGGAVLDQVVLWSGKWGGASHLALKGVHARRGVSIQKGFDNAPRLHHIKIMDVIAESEIGISHGDDILVEGGAVFGDGRYKLSAYKSARVVFRRIVTRLDHAPLQGQQNPFGMAAAYSSDDVVFQNVIDIDSDQVDAYPIGEQTGAFSVPTTAGASNRIVYDRSIVLNNALKLGSYDATNGMADVTYRDLIAWDIRTFEGLEDLSHGFGHGLFDHATVGRITTAGDFSDWGAFGYFNGWGAGYDAVRNSLLSDFDGPPFIDIEGLSTNAFHLIEPFDASGPDHEPATFQFLADLDGTLSALPRIDPGSPLSGAAEDGGDIGATVTTFVGRSGTLHGEPGWDAETGISMWPFPHEDRIAQAMAAYRYTGTLPQGQVVDVRGDRGFAAGGVALDGGPVTLTSYIWEYLGTPCPPAVCRR